MAAPVPIRSSVQPTTSKGGPVAKPAAKPGKAAAPALDPATLRAAQALTNVALNPSITDLTSQIAANNKQTQGTIGLTSSAYNQLEPFVQKGVDQQGQISSGLNSTLQGIGNDTQSQMAGLGQNALSSLLKYAPQGEGGIANAATSDLAAQIAKQQGLAAQQAGTYRAFGANQGANYQGLNNSQLGTYGLQGQEALKNIAQSGTVKNEPLVSKIAGLQGQRGSLNAANYGKITQQNTANQIAQAGLGLKQQTLATTAANDRAKIATAQRGQNVTLRGQTLANQGRLAAIAQSNLNNLRTTNTSAANNAANNSTRQLIAAMKGNGRTNKPATGAQANAIFSHVDYVTGEIQNLISHGLSPKDAYHLVQNGGRVQTGTTASGTATYRTYYPNKLGTQVLNAAYNVRPGAAGLTAGDLAWFASLGIKNPTRYAHANQRGTGAAVSNAGKGKSVGGF